MTTSSQLPANPAATVETAAEAVIAPAVYFGRPGRDNTEETLRLAKKRAEELGINSILVATTRGNTASRASEVFEGFHLVIVTHSTGHREPNTQELELEHRALIEAKGGIIYTGTHAFRGVEIAFLRHMQVPRPTDIVAQTLRVFGEGMKVVCEIAVMAADAGLVRTDEEVVAIAGTGRGADTAVVLKPAHAKEFFELRIKEIICKPRL